jgi:hypothetical protein
VEALATRYEEFREYQPPRWMVHYKPMAAFAEPGTSMRPDVSR